MDEMIEKIEYLMKKHPEKIVEFTKQMYKYDPKSVERMLSDSKGDGYIANRKKYEELIEKLKWANGSGRGAKWSFEDIKKNSRIDFSNTDYTEFDYAFLVNMLYAKCCKEFNDPSFYLKLAKCLLEDNDEETKLYKGAYHKDHKQSGHKSRYSEYGDDEYDRYDEEDRRHRRYRNDTNDRMENYNRRYTDNEYDGYYRENNIGFTH